MITEGQKMNFLPRHKKAWMDLKCIFPSERSKTQNATYCMIPTRIRHSGKSQTL